MKLSLFALLIPATMAHAQYTVDWSTMDGGGGGGSAGSYSMQGTIGQPDATSSAAGNFTFLGGYWSLDEVPPVLRIFLAGLNVVLAWPDPSSGYQLQASPGLLPSNWADVLTVPVVVDNEKQVTWGLPVGSHFFRLHRP